MSAMDPSAAQALVAALLRIEQARHPVMDRTHVRHVLQQVVHELAQVVHPDAMTLTLHATLFDPPFPLVLTVGDTTLLPTATVVPLQWAGLQLATLHLTPVPSAGVAATLLPVLLRVASESIAEVYETERLVQTATWQTRQQLAREVHEEVKQVLPAIRLFAEQAERLVQTNPTKAASLMGDVRESAQQGLDALTLWIGEMQHLSTEDTLQHALERLVAQVSRMQPDLALACALAPPPLPWQLGTCVLGIVRNALMNVVQHAEAHHVEVRVVAEHGGVQVSVVDDGVGCDPDAALAAPGIGLNSLMERVRELHGQTQLTAAPGEGVAISVWLPVEPPREPTNQEA